MSLGSALRIARNIFAIGLVGSLLLVFCATYTQALDPTRAALWVLGAALVGVVLIVLGTLMQVLVTELLTALREDGVPRFERHWGGLGGTVGGWSLSRAFVVLIGIGLTLAALLATFGEVKFLSGFLLDKEVVVEGEQENAAEGDTQTTDKTTGDSTQGGGANGDSEPDEENGSDNSAGEGDAE